MLRKLIGRSRSHDRSLTESFDATATTSSVTSGSYESSSEDSEQDFDIFRRYIPPENFKTNLMCIILTGFSHYIYGIFFNANESVNARYEYPNIGSSCFVLATSLYLIRLDLSLKRLPIEMRTWKYSVYKVLAVMFLTHLILEGIWQQMVNLSWELIFIGKEFLEILYDKTGSQVFGTVSSYVTMTTARYVTNVEGAAILAYVLYTTNITQEY